MSTMEVTIDDQIAEVKRELAMRKNFYARQIQVGRMKVEDAQKHWGRLLAALRTLETVKGNAAIHPNFTGAEPCLIDMQDNAFNRDHG